MEPLNIWKILRENVNFDFDFVCLFVCIVYLFSFGLVHFGLSIEIGTICSSTWFECAEWSTQLSPTWFEHVDAWATLAVRPGSCSGVGSHHLRCQDPSRFNHGAIWIPIPVGSNLFGPGAPARLVVLFGLFRPKTN